MTVKTSRAPKTATSPPKKKTDPNIFRVVTGEDFSKDMTESEVLAVLATRSSSLSSITLKAFSGTGDKVEVTDLQAQMKKLGEEVSGGNLKQVEKMLVYQAVTLDAIFNSLAQKATRAEHMKSMEAYTRLAMKAQSQSRATIETIGLLKNPAPYIRQANIATGHQQVNNAYAVTSAHTHAGNNPFTPNKLLEGQQHGERMDMGTAATPGRADTQLEALGAIDRTQDTRRQAKGR